MRTLLTHYYRFSALLGERIGPVIDLLVRLYIARVFFLSGLTKLDDWGTTIALFTDEYHVPVLPPEVAAYAGTAGELGFSVLLGLGLLGRLGAAGLFGVNVMAVVAYWHELGMQDALLIHHLCWGLLLAMLVSHGAGPLSADHWLQKWARRRADQP